MQAKWIAKSRFCALSHAYYYEQGEGARILKSILNDDELIIGDREDQYPGVYMNFQQMGDVLNPYSDILIFVFSTALLKSPAWHTSDTGYGVIDDTSYCPKTFDKCKTTPVELVFHHEVSLEYLEFIVAPEQYYDEISSIVDGRWTVYFGNHKLDRVYSNLLMNKSMYADVPFSLGYLVDNPDIEYTPHIIKSTMLNMGYTPKIIKTSFHNDDVDTISKGLQIESKKNIDYPVIVYCPY